MPINIRACRIVITNSHLAAIPDPLKSRRQRIIQQQCADEAFAVPVISFNISNACIEPMTPVRARECPPQRIPATNRLEVLTGIYLCIVIGHAVIVRFIGLQCGDGPIKAPDCGGDQRNRQTLAYISGKVTGGEIVRTVRHNIIAADQIGSIFFTNRQ